MSKVNFVILFDLYRKIYLDLNEENINRPIIIRLV